jgi:hypothetical protein
MDAKQIKSVRHSSWSLSKLKKCDQIPRVLWTIIFSAFLFFETSSALDAQTSESELIEKFTEIMERDGSFAELIANRNIDFSVGKLELYEEHFRLLFGRNGMIEFMASEVAPVLDVIGSDRIGAFSTALIQSKAALGIKRLNADEIRTMFEYGYKGMVELSDGDCAALINGTGGALAESDIELRVANLLSDVEVRSYLHVTRKAIFGEIFDDPLFVPLGSTERQIANDVFSAEFTEALLDHPRIQALIYVDTVNFSAASDRDLCELGRLSILTALQIEGTVGDWVLKLFAEDAQ